jgi:hypothetical protein
VQPVDVNLSLDHALRIAERRLRGRVEIVRDYRELPKIPPSRTGSRRFSCT